MISRRLKLLIFKKKIKGNQTKGLTKFSSNYISFMNAIITEIRGEEGWGWG
jgi:hypothetical protein